MYHNKLEIENCVPKYSRRQELNFMVSKNDKLRLCGGRGKVQEIHQQIYRHNVFRAVRVLFIGHEIWTKLSVISVKYYLYCWSKDYADIRKCRIDLSYLQICGIHKYHYDVIIRNTFWLFYWLLWEFKDEWREEGYGRLCAVNLMMHFQRCIL